MAILKVDTAPSTILDSCTLNSNSFSGINRVFLSVPGFYFDTVTDFESSSEWVTEITAENIYEFDQCKQVNDLSEAPVYNKSRNAQQYPVRPGRVIHEYFFNYSDSFHKKLVQFDQNDYEVYLSDRNNNLYGTSDDDVTVRGFRVNVLSVQKRNFASTQKVFSVLRIEYADFKEFDVNSIISNVTWLHDRIVTT